MYNISGEATQKATEFWMERINNEKGWQFSTLGRTKFKVSQAGFGCYRVHYKNEEHYKSLHMALSEGINLIDTSSNYSWGGSETLVGQVVKDMIEGNLLKRKEVVVVTKIGYVQGPAMEVAIERRKKDNPFPEMVYYSDNCWHCIHPEFLEDQLDRSLKRLDMEKIDILLLHNPEYFLSLANKKGQNLDETRKQYYERIEKAFLYLEEQVKHGKISWYGISSNSFPAPSSDFEHTSLERIWEIASNISSDHHFAVIQLPANLYESGAILCKNQKNNTYTVIELAEKLNLGVLVNRPLNSYYENRLIRLSDFNPPVKLEEQDVIKCLSKLRSIDISIYSNSFSRNLTHLLETGNILELEWKNFSGLDHWNIVKDNQLIPPIESILHSSPQMKIVKDYIDQLNLTFETITNFYTTKAQEISDSLHLVLNKFLPDNIKKITLSKKAIWLLRTIPSINTVLVGMRRESYVKDITDSLTIPSKENGLEIWKELENEL